MFTYTIEYDIELWRIILDKQKFTHVYAANIISNTRSIYAEWETTLLDNSHEAKKHDIWEYPRS